MEPVHYSHTGFSLLSLSHEVLLVACFCITFVVVKEILVLNQFREAWLSVFIVPLYFLVAVDQCKSMRGFD